MHIMETECDKGIATTIEEDRVVSAVKNTDDEVVTEPLANGLDKSPKVEENGDEEMEVSAEQQPIEEAIEEDEEGDDDDEEEEESPSSVTVPNSTISTTSSSTVLPESSESKEALVENGLNKLSDDVDATVVEDFDEKSSKMVNDKCRSPVANESEGGDNKPPSSVPSPSADGCPESKSPSTPESPVPSPIFKDCVPTSAAATTGDSSTVPDEQPLPLSMAPSSPPATSPVPATNPAISIKGHKEEELSEEDDRLALPRAIKQIQPEVEVTRKRTSVDREADCGSSSSSGGESDTARKRIKPQVKEEPPPPTSSRPHSSFTDHLITTEDERENTIHRFMESCAQSLEEINTASEKLHKEMNALAELAKAKELEWNSILRLRKLKEEMYERLQRRKREMLINDGKYHEDIMLASHVSHQLGGGSVTMYNTGSTMGCGGKSVNQQHPRHILPKPYGLRSLPLDLPPNHQHHVQAPSREGRNGHMIDVKSLIADYGYGGPMRGSISVGRRNRDGLIASRRGRKMRAADQLSVSASSMSSPSLISMANLALGTGSNVVRTMHDPPPYHPPPNSSAMPVIPGVESMNREYGGSSGGNSFKDTLMQFAKLHGGGGGRSAPQYPEVTLHPVGSSPSSSATSSLLHGILTKGPPTSASHIPMVGHQGGVHATSSQSQQGGTVPPPNAHSNKQNNTTYSPTLARLLTAPDPPRHPQPAHQNASTAGYHRPPSLNINILASKKARTDITITPVSSNSTLTTLPKEEVVLLDDDEDASGGDRLVIDEGGDGNSDEVPQCQGCRQKPAQFVCAGCGNQWYCSRECQVSAWEEHSDVCSG